MNARRKEGRRRTGRRLVLIVAVAATAVLAGAATPAFTADTGTLQLQVQAQAPAAACITLGLVHVDFGSLPFSRTAELSYNNAPPITVTNCGTATEDIWARGTDASGVNASWSLTEVGTAPPTPCAHGVDAYGLQVSPNGGQTWSELVTQNRVTRNGLGAGSSYTEDLLLIMPCTGSSGAGQTMSMQVVYTAV